jgi:hypothetical protein
MTRGVARYEGVGHVNAAVGSFMPHWKAVRHVPASGIPGFALSLGLGTVAALCARRETEKRR